ncbi:agmatine deiminase family protein [Oligoflexus tunisiensis]|uniref:agmatine deiminase family protein n=1 Tax=Oligoflexus tunisiensis TaxID=708132 RepID=UPI00114D2E7C|nr:agmatine deiminase family protein [Oligoflexus tunisiensis]
MRNFLGLLSWMAIIAAASPLQAEVAGPLPNYATPEEIRSATAADWELPSYRDSFRPSPGLRLPAEYEPMAAVVMTYAGYPQFIQSIARAVVDAGAKAYVLGGPSSISGLDSSRYQSLNISYNTIWSRDFGPVAINEQTGELAIVDTIYRHYAYRKADDAVPARIADFLGMERYDAPIILDGGNLMVDRRGHLYMTERTYEWNSQMSRSQVDQYLKEYFGVKKIHVIPYAASRPGTPADGTGHIDMFVKILDDCKVLVAKSSSQPFASALENASQYFSNSECSPGRNWDVYRVQGYASSGVWYTFTNSLIVNNSVIIPSYANYDEAEARRVYAQALPNHKQVFVNSDGPIQAAGAIHCTTKEIPAVNGF